jgi:hypothetical protein
MRGLQVLMMLIGALAVLMIPALPAAASTPPCHEMTLQGGTDSPAPSPEKPVKVMNCCVACDAAPAIDRPERSRVAPLRVVVIVRPAALPAGLAPSPEPHPPRTTAS